jgi:hypothetical protein
MYGVLLLCCYGESHKCYAQAATALLLPVVAAQHWLAGEQQQHTTSVYAPQQRLRIRSSVPFFSIIQSD